MSRSAAMVTTSCSTCFDVDEWVSLAAQCQYLPEQDMKALCERVVGLLLEEPNVVPVASPVTVCGDIHGQYFDLEVNANNNPDEPYSW